MNRRLSLMGLVLGVVWAVAQDGWAAKQTPPDSPVTPTNYGYIVLSDASFHEDMPVVGTPFVLHYSSRRTRGYMPAYNLVVWYADPNTFPNNMISVELTVNIAGRIFRHTQAAPFTNHYWSLLWDGRDAESNFVYGTTPAVVDSTAIFMDKLTLDEYENVSGERYSGGLFITSSRGAISPIDGGYVLDPHAIVNKPITERSGLYSVAGESELYTEDQLRQRPIIPWYTSRKKKGCFLSRSFARQLSGVGWLDDQFISFVRREKRVST
ncbi:MAG: hypothetical protein M5U15_03695 [Kiritimatiellae bacterium]|nr:hypothetical protein [Kiritimatiellia bacterium]